MKLLLVLFATVAVLAAAVSASSLALAAATSSSAGRDTALLRLPPAAPAGQWVVFGHIRSLARKSGRFEMRFDPAWLLSGVAAERAAVEDKAISPGDPVPNDYYIVEEGHRLLTFVVAAKAPVTILTRGVGKTTITVSELAQILGGKNPKHRPLLGPLRGFGDGFGFWIRVGDKYPNPVRSLDQQYQP
jgi:hypothetical protein